MTDTDGTMQVTYALPPAGAVTERNAQITLIVARRDDDDESVAVSTSIVFALSSPM